MAKILAEGYMGEKKSFNQDPWPELYESMKLGLIIQGKVSGIEKSDGKTNLIVFIGPLKGIIPEDEVGLHEGQKPQFAVGSTVAFKVKHCDRSAGIVYLSRREATEEMCSITWQELKRDAGELIALSKEVEELKEQLKPHKTEEITVKELSAEEKAEIEKTIRQLQAKMREIGPVRTCVAKHVTYNGAYVDIGGVSAFIPKYEMSWGFVEDARDILQVGDAFDVKLIDINENGVTASIKLLLPNPWENAEVKYIKGGIYTGKIVKEIAKGMLIELEPGITAFAPRLPLGNPVLGSEVLFKVGRVIPQDRRMNGWVIKVTRRAD